MTIFLATCLSLFSDTVQAIASIDIFEFFLGFLLLAVAFTLFILLNASAKK